MYARKLCAKRRQSSCRKKFHFFHYSRRITTRTGTFACEKNREYRPCHRNTDMEHGKERVWGKDPQTRERKEKGDEKKRAVRSFDRDALGQIARLIHVAASPVGDFVGEQLRWNSVQQWIEVFVYFGQRNNILGQGGQVLVTARSE